MEKEILDILKSMQLDMQELKKGQKRLESKVDNLEKGQEEIKYSIKENNIELKHTLIDMAERFDRIEYKIDRTDNEVISIKTNLKVIK